jgi:hypothetical protein
MFQSRAECDAVFDQMDVNHNGVISRKAFEEFVARRRGGAPMTFKSAPTSVPPPPQTMASAVTGAPIAAKYYDVSEELSDEVRTIKDVRRLFALAGPLLLVILAFLPCWSALALLKSRTYLYFAGYGTPLGGIMLFIAAVVGLWMNCIMGVGCPTCPMPNPLRPLYPVWERIKLLPIEAYTMIALSVTLMLMWKLVPIIYVGGIVAAFRWLGSLFYIFDLMWFSSNPAATILASAFTAIVLYNFSLNYFLARGKPEARGTTRSLFVIWTVFVLFMGVAFMLLSVPISFEADKAYNELLLNCETGARTQDLFVTSQALQTLRQSASCSGSFSVEQCVGFQSTVYTRVLKSMETDFKCSGFCYNPALQTTLGQPEPVSNLVQPQSSDYPPTLFTQANYQASCDGMAARNMHHFVGATGTLVFAQGVLLVLVALVLSLIQMISICAGNVEKDGLEVGEDTYGSMM